MERKDRKNGNWCFVPRVHTIFLCAVHYHIIDSYYLLLSRNVHTAVLWLPSNYILLLCIGSKFTRNIKIKRFLKMFYSPKRTDEINTQWNVNNFLMDFNFHAHCGQKKTNKHNINYEKSFYSVIHSDFSSFFLSKEENGRQTNRSLIRNNK